MWSILERFHEAFLSGFIVTMQLSSIIWTSGIVIGGVLGWLAISIVSGLSKWIRIGTFLIGSIPPLIILIWFHYPLQSIFGIVVQPFWTASFALSLVNTFVVAEIVIWAHRGVDFRYSQMGMVAGLNSRQQFFVIQMPLLLQRIVGPLLFSQVVMLQTTLFASLISVEELFRAAQRVNAIVYRPVEVYSLLAVFFLFICAPLNFFAWRLTKKIRGR